jgi:hypothetical protein
VSSQSSARLARKPAAALEKVERIGVVEERQKNCKQALVAVAPMPVCNFFASPQQHRSAVID